MARKLLKKELREQMEKEKVEIFPQIKVLKDAVKNLKPCFEIFGLTLFKTSDVANFYSTLKEWTGEAPHRVARKKFWGIFDRMTKRKPEAPLVMAAEVSPETLAATIPPHKVEMQ